MTIAFPESWSDLKWPHVRAELLNYLQIASKPDLWRDTVELKFLVHFVFDDHDFRPVEQLIGDILLTPDEANAIEEFAANLDRAIGPHEKPLSAVKQPEWAPVAQAAESAFKVLISAGTPLYG